MSYQSSVTFATVESIFILNILLRAVHSKQEHVRQQLFALPMMVSIFFIEVIEALLWSRPEELIPITDAATRRCPTRNAKLTLLAWLCIIFQPLYVTWSCRRTGDARNWSVFLIPERMSMAFAISMVVSYLYTALSPSMPLHTLADTNYTSYYNNETCTYIGKAGHLHWTLAIVDSYLAPNAYPYVLIWASCVFARPLHLVSGILLFGLFLFVLFLIGYHGRFEAGSVWCWSAIIMHLYIFLHPVLFSEYDKAGAFSEKQTWASIHAREAVLPSLATHKLLE